MKTDWKLLGAIIVLILLVTWLLVISLHRSEELDHAIQTIKVMQQKIEQPTTVAKAMDGKTPVLGVDYFNGRDGKDAPLPKDGKDGQPGESAYQIAQRHGFTGTEQEWLESLKPKVPELPKPPQLLIDCINNKLAKKMESDLLWQITSVKCEVIND